MLREVGDSTYVDSGKDVFHYEYLRELEAKIGTTRKVVWGTYAEPIYAKIKKIGLISMSL